MKKLVLEGGKGVMVGGGKDGGKDGRGTGCVGGVGGYY